MITWLTTSHRKILTLSGTVTFHTFTIIFGIVSIGASSCVINAYADLTANLPSALPPQEIRSFAQVTSSKTTETSFSLVSCDTYVSFPCSIVLVIISNNTSHRLISLNCVILFGFVTFAINTTRASFVPLGSTPDSKKFITNRSSDSSSISQFR
ncbi:unnamed protein product [Cochlearia groenlandica]